VKHHRSFHSHWSRPFVNCPRAIVFGVLFSIVLGKCPQLFSEFVLSESVLDRFREKISLNIFFGNCARSFYKNCPLRFQILSSIVVGNCPRFFGNCHPSFLYLSPYYSAWSFFRWVSCLMQNVYMNKFVNTSLCTVKYNCVTSTPACRCYVTARIQYSEK
jgi:hypothetical protein